MILAEAVCIWAFVTSILDGDTFKVKAEIWPDITVETSIRINGIDTPEKGWRGKCKEEKKLGARATKWAKENLPEKVLICNIKNGKYAGRVVADVFINEDKYADLIIAEGLAKPYDGGTKSDWCSK